MNIEKKLKVGVIFGGRSHEKEISLESGRNVFYKLASDRFELIPLYLSYTLQLYELPLHFLVRNSTAEIEVDAHTLTPIFWSNLASRIDFAFIALHGDVGEDGTLQGALELLGIPYNGSGVAASALCMNKILCKALLEQNGCRVPRGIAVKSNDWFTRRDAILAQIAEQLPGNTIVKPHDDGCSFGVQSATSLAQVAQALDAIFALHKSVALVEELIQGIELSIGVIGNKDIYAFEPTETIASKGVLSIEEKFLPGAGENRTPARLPESTRHFLRKEAEKAYKIAGCKGYARIDCFYQSSSQSPFKTDQLVILEINSLPGLTPATCIFHQAAEHGMSPLVFLEKIIALGVELHAPKMMATWPWLNVAIKEVEPLLFGAHTIENALL